MRRMVWRGTTAGLVMLLICGVAVADKDTYQPPQPVKKKSWWWPFGGSSKKEDTAKKPAKPTEKSASEKQPKIKETVEAPMPAATSVAAETSVSVSREQAKFIRRQQVCDRISEIAQESGNTELEKQAQLLAQRAWHIYEERTVQARLPTLQPLEKTAAAKRLMDDVPRKRADDQPLRSVSARNRTPDRED